LQLREDLEADACLTFELITSRLRLASSWVIEISPGFALFGLRIAGRRPAKRRVPDFYPCGLYAHEIDCRTCHDPRLLSEIVIGAVLRENSNQPVYLAGPGGIIEDVDGEPMSP
jgi:hypothetical protein